MRTTNAVPCLILVAAAALSGERPALAASAPNDAIEGYLRQEAELRKIPGLAWAVVENGAITKQGALGLADVENGAPVTEKSIFAIASLDKQLTAAGVMKAAELGKLKLDDPISKWVEIELPDATVKDLIAHTSGLPDQVAGSIEGRYYTDYTSAQLLETVRGLAPVAPPGHRFLYSDAGLFLAQLATEKAAGEPWWEFMRRELFVPAGMTTPLSMVPGALIPGRVMAYTLDGERNLVRDRRLDVDFGPLYSDLGMTVADFARWLGALEAGKPLSAASVATMTTPVRLETGQMTGELFQWSRYGLGVGLDEFLGEPIVLHSGHSGVGFVRFPERKLAVVVFTNLEHPAGSDPVGLAMGIAGLLRPELSLAALPGSSAGATARADYEAFLGEGTSLERYAPGFRITAWGAGLSGRAPGWGELRRFDLVRDAMVDGEPSRLYRATHERATVYVRFSYDAAGKITRVVWWHP